MLSWFYQILWQIAPPVIRYYLRRRAQKNPAYAEHWAERFGQPHPSPVTGAVWLHAVSVGETRAAQPLIAALRRRFPDAPLLITQMTPTGRATAQALYPDAQCRYLPYDRRDWVAQFLREHHPLFGVVMETELWANLLNEAHRQKIPMFVANARLSEKSARGYRRIDALIRPALQTLAGCLAQTEEDAARLRQLGAANVSVCGNSKYDIAPPEDKIELAAQWRRHLGRRRVFVAASTREKDGTDEAHEIVRAWRQHGCADDLLVLVPRHPERFGAAAEYAQSLGLTVQKRSSGEAVSPSTQVWVGDSMGEMFAYYALADAVFVGGSLVDTGCQNIIEPMSCGKPVLFGPSVYNFQAACTGALVFGAARQIASADELVQTVYRWWQNPEEAAALAQRAVQFVAQHKGASECMAQRIEDGVKRQG